LPVLVSEIDKVRARERVAARLAEDLESTGGRADYLLDSHSGTILWNSNYDATYGVVIIACYVHLAAEPIEFEHCIDLPQGPVNKLGAAAVPVSKPQSIT